MSSEREDLAMHPARLRELRAHAEQNVRRGYGFVEFLSAGETLVLLDMIAAGWRPPTERTDAEVDAAQLAYHEVAFGPGHPLSKRDLGITRQAMRAALEAADRARLDIDAASREDR